MFLDDCSSFIENEYGVSARTPRRSGDTDVSKVMVLEYYAMSDVANIARFMYEGATVFLQRKFDIVRPLLNAQGF